MERQGIRSTTGSGLRPPPEIPDPSCRSSVLRPLSSALALCPLYLVLCTLLRMTAQKVVATNRQARFNYEILDTFEAGMVLLGSEVKSLRAGQVQLKDAYGDIRAGEMWLESAHISPYQFAAEGGHEPERSRKLLLHKREIDRLISRIREEGLTLVPTKIYFLNGRAKVELGLGKGKKRHDKRQSIVEKRQKREMERARSHRR